MNTKTAIVTGITGQDGAYLAQRLLAHGYRVIGAYRRTSTTNFWRLEYLGVRDHPQLHLVHMDITDPSNCINLVQETRPSEIYNLAAQSFVEASFNMPVATAQITGVGALHLLEAVRLIDRDIRFYQASTSELYGKVQETPQSETTPFYPRSPYGVAKLYAHWITRNYQESYDIFSTSGILFNHESPLRGLEFVTRKITDGVARIKLGLADRLLLGNLSAERDWGHASEYVAGMHQMLMADSPGTYVLATGRSESVRSFTTMAFSEIGVELEFEGEGVAEIGVDRASGKTLVAVDSRYFRSAEVEALIGDPSRARKELGWQATIGLEQMCSEMVASDIDKIRQGKSF